MHLTPDQKLVIEQIVNVFETGRRVGNYAAVAILRDGPAKCLQVTYGRSQTTEFGRLGELLKMYVAAEGSYAAALEPYLAKIGVRPLVGDMHFIRTLKDAGTNDGIMQKIQDEFFDKNYFQPAIKWAGDYGFTLPLSALVIYDSFIHSGSVPGFLRKRFPEVPPTMGGNEKVWIAQYLAARNVWLANHSNKVLRPTAYRTKFMLGEVAIDNWELETGALICQGVKMA